MARKKDSYYFDTFVELVNYSCQAANLLNQIMNNSKLKNYPKNEGNARYRAQRGPGRHVMIRKLAKEFITPIEREDIMALADAIDNVTDAIEDVVMRMYMYILQVSVHRP